jgi:hypothetical protein
VSWTSIDALTAQAAVTIGGARIPLALTIAPDGRLQSVTMARWGNPATDGQYACIPLGAEVLAERTFGGYTVPSRS